VQQLSPPWISKIAAEGPGHGMGSLVASQRRRLAPNWPCGPPDGKRGDAPYNNMVSSSSSKSWLDLAQLDSGSAKRQQRQQPLCTRAHRNIAIGTSTISRKTSDSTGKFNGQSPLDTRVLPLSVRMHSDFRKLSP
jgi:hypothetical protein